MKKSIIRNQITIAVLFVLLPTIITIMANKAGTSPITMWDYVILGCNVLIQTLICIALINTQLKMLELTKARSYLEGAEDFAEYLQKKEL